MNDKGESEKLTEKDYVYLNIWLNDDLSEIKTSKVIKK